MKKEYRNSIKTKMAIREAFVDLVSEKKDIHRISVTELIDKANIAKSTFYLHYNDIYNVAEEFENEIINTMNSIIANTIPTINSFENSLNLAIDYIKENENIYSKIVNSSAPMFFIDKLKYILIKETFTKIDFPFLSKDVNIRNAQIRFFANGTIDLIVDYFKGNLHISLDEIKNLIIILIKKL